MYQANSISWGSWGWQRERERERERCGGWLPHKKRKYFSCFHFEFFSLLRLQNGKKIYPSVWIETKENVYSYSVGECAASTWKAFIIIE